MIRSLFVPALLGAALASAACANDTTARVGAGGIEFVKSADVRMLQETLTISKQQVRVRYRFLDEGDADVHATIAFPLPRYGDYNVDAAVEANRVRMTSFAVQADGRPVATRTIRRALAGGRDVTAQLHAIGLTDIQIFETFGHPRLDEHEFEFTPAQQRGLRALLGPGSALNAWEVEETRVWEQTFPAHREVVVEHAYAPFVGIVYDVPYQGKTPIDLAQPLHPSSFAGPERLPAEACVDADLQARMDRRVRTLAAGGAKEVARELRDVEYILGTGRNWKGPIGEFTLRVEKSSPDEIVSLCFPGKPVRVDATTLEFHQRDFVPQDRLVVYFYEISAGKAPGTP